MSKLIYCAAVTFALLVAAAGGANAQEKYPTKPIRLIVPYAPGGGADTMARVILQRVSEPLGQPVVVDNRAGGSGTIGVEMAVRASPDGYTLVIVSSSYPTYAPLYKLPYDPVNDIQPIILLGEAPLLMTLHPSVPSKSVKEFIAYAKANPGKLNFGSAGIGGIAYLAAKLFKLETKVDFIDVAYKGSGPVMIAHIGGEVQIGFSGIVSPLPHVKAGRLRAIGVTTAKRSSALPDVPAIGETVPGYEVVNWYGVLGPKGLPKDIVARWNKEVAKVLQTNEMRSRLVGEGMELAGGPPEQFLNAIRRDVEKWTRVVKEAKITLEN